MEVFHTLRSVVYFLRANIEGEVWLIVPECTLEMWGTFLKFEGGVRGCVPDVKKYIYSDIRTPKSKNEFVGDQYRTTPSPILPPKPPF